MNQTALLLLIFCCVAPFNVLIAYHHFRKVFIQLPRLSSRGLQCLLQPVLATLLLLMIQQHLLIRRLKATAIDVMTLAQGSIELPNDAVSDTTEADSSNEDHYTIH